MKDAHIDERKFDFVMTDQWKPVPLRSTKGVGNTSVHGSLVEYRLRKDVDARCDLLEQLK